MIETISLHFVAFQLMALVQILAHGESSSNANLLSTVVKADVAKW